MRAPRLPSIFKYRSARQFNMSTRYFDERKERIRLVKEKHEEKNEDYFLNKLKSKNPGYEIKSFVRLIVILFALCLLTYYILKY